MTIPLVMALGGGNQTFRRQVEALYGGGNGMTIPAVIAAIETEGGLRGTQEQIDAYAAKANLALDVLPPTAATAELRALAAAIAAPDLKEKV